MAVCELDNEISGEVLGWKLPAWQALLLHRVLPSCGGLVLYMTVICFDITLVVQQYQSGSESIAVFGIIVMILPALLSMVFSLASPPPGLQTDESATKVEIEKSDALWILMQIANFIFFPVAAVGRYCHQIFWWIEAVCASFIDDDDRTKDALRRVRAPSPLELYLFLQSFLHSAPYATVNILDMMTSADLSYSKLSVQAVSIVAASLRMASTATLYRRFEREKICGRKYPWSLNQTLIDNAVNENLEKENVTKEHIYETVPRKASYGTLGSEESDVVQPRKLNSDLIQFTPKVEDTPFFDDCHSDSGSEYLPPVVIVKDVNETYRSDSEDEYVRPKSIIERVAPRRSTQITIEAVEITPPPRFPAPRMSLAVWAEKMVENAESIPDWLSAPTRRKQHLEVIKEPDLPKAVPRKYMRGLQPQDGAAAVVSFLGWHMFFVSRLLSIAAFINFYPIVAIIILACHYQIVLLLLIVPKASTVRRGFYLFLAFIYLFCLMEFKIRFRHVRAWHTFWLVACTLETVLFTSLWATIDNVLSSWWRNYVVIVIFGSMLLSYMCMLVYFVLLKPGETVIYIDEKNCKRTR